jgi:hypothetical protein
MYELHVRPLSSLIARIESLESACHLAQLRGGTRRRRAPYPAPL